MPKKILPILLLIILVTIQPTLKCSATNTRATVHYVDPGQSIQEAIDAAQAGDTIIVRAGVYHEIISVSKALTLQGEKRETTIIDGDEANRTIIEVTSSNVAINNLTVQNTSRAAGTSYAGIKILGQNCNITDNHVTKTKIGIFVTSQNTRVTSNIATLNGHGIALYSSTNTTVKANNVTANTVGISLALSYDNIIEDNTARNSSTGGHGITLSSNSYSNTIRQNNLIYNYHGMWLSSSTTNKIVNNTIAFNKLLGTELASSSNNTFYQNDFINNPKHIVTDDGSINTWDNTTSGNFWDDYGQLDLDGDGIGDLNYTINTNNQDHYPLTIPQRPIPIMWNATIYPMKLESNSTISRITFITTRKTISFNVTGSDSTIGHCNITLPTTLVQKLWNGNINVFVAGSQPITTSNSSEGSDTHLSFTYYHSEKQVEIVPENLPPTLMIIILALAFVTSVIVKQKNYCKIFYSSNK